MSHESVWYSRPRTYGKGSRNCVVTGEKKKAGIIRKYGLNMSRQAFREKAADIGFVKVSRVGLCSKERSRVRWCMRRDM
ncbi:40S ribosomal protein S29 [Plenodomus lingam]|uniref:40S ribosomal protein uS14 n=1 Tax=Leptosphaeria maculans TaxID=5022 RepID=UPI0033215081|nr:40S ribosomal protein S29 [Plenodomus lingam]